MSNDLGLLVVDRWAFLRGRAPGGPPKRAPGIQLSHEQVSATYRGFDGEIWPDETRGKDLAMQGALVELAKLDLVRTYTASLSHPDDCEIVSVSRVNADDQILISGGWQLLGIDIGYLDSPWSHFSSILNEVIYGIHAPLRAFAKELNESLLLKNPDDAARLLRLRSDLEKLGFDVETDDGQMQALRVYGHPSFAAGTATHS